MSEHNGSFVHGGHCRRTSRPLNSTIQEDNGQVRAQKWRKSLLGRFRGSLLRAMNRNLSKVEVVIARNQHSDRTGVLTFHMLGGGGKLSKSSRPFQAITAMTIGRS